MKALNDFAGPLLTILARMPVGVMGWLSPPEADAVCGNVARLFKDKTGAILPENERGRCEKQATKAPEFGRGIWVKQLKCMRDAQSYDDLKSCDSIKTL